MRLTKQWLTKQGRRRLHQGGGKTAAVARVSEEGLAVVWVSGEFARRPGGRHNLRVCDPPIDCDLLPGDAARVQALQSLQYDDKRHEDRGGRSAGYHGPVLPNRDYLYHLVHIRVNSALPRLPKQIQLLPWRNEHHRYHRDHSVLHHPRHSSGREGGHAEST